LLTIVVLSDIIDHDRPSYKDPPKEIATLQHIKWNHFNEWISQIQGKETTDIPEEVYDKILLEIKKKTKLIIWQHTNKVKEILKN
jgi:predicted metallo-beta-lactamase superfamily hydrolase